MDDQQTPEKSADEQGEWIAGYIERANAMVAAWQRLPPVVDDDFPARKFEFDQDARAFFEHWMGREAKRRFDAVPGLAFATLKRANLLRCALFKDAHGRLSHPGGVSDWTVDQWLKAVLGELGEFANLSKKVDRGDFTLEDSRADLAKELADVTIYLDLLASRMGIDLGREVLAKFNEVSERQGISLTIKDTYLPDPFYRVPVHQIPAKYKEEGGDV